MSAFSKGRAGAFPERWVGPALTVVLLYAGCATGAQFPPGPPLVEFHVEFVDLASVPGIYEFRWEAMCSDCAAEVPDVSCTALFDRSELVVNAQVNEGMVVLPAFPLPPTNTVCLTPLISAPGHWLYHLVVKRGDPVPAEEVVNASCDAEIFGGEVNVIQYTQLAEGEFSNSCAPELGGT